MTKIFQKNIKNKKGLAFMPTVLMIGVIMAELGIALVFLIYLSNLSSFSTRVSQEAMFAARTGVNDAILRIGRDKTFPSGFSNYEMSIGRVAVLVNIQKNTPGNNQDTIVSTASVRSFQRVIQAIISINAKTDEVTIVSMEEI